MRQVQSFFATRWRSRGDIRMSSQLSVAQVLANLEEQMRFHREREAEHAAQEAFHRDQRAVHAAEYETVARHYEAFKASAAGAAEIAARSGVPAPPPEEPLPLLTPVLPSRPTASARTSRWWIPVSRSRSPPDLIPPGPRRPSRRGP